LENYAVEVCGRLELQGIQVHIMTCVCGIDEEMLMNFFQNQKDITVEEAVFRGIRKVDTWFMGINHIFRDRRMVIPDAVIEPANRSSA